MFLFSNPRSKLERMEGTHPRLYVFLLRHEIRICNSRRKISSPLLLSFKTKRYYLEPTKLQLRSMDIPWRAELQCRLTDPDIMINRISIRRPSYGSSMVVAAKKVKMKFIC